MGVDGEARIGYASSVDGEFPSPPPPLKETPPMTKNKPVKTDTETITKISDFVWELSTEMDTIREQMEDLQIRMLSIRKMLQIMENPKNK
jgi:hypothetical protein